LNCSLTLLFPINFFSVGLEPWVFVYLHILLGFWFGVTDWLDFDLFDFDWLLNWWLFNLLYVSFTFLIPRLVVRF
jgi:hypothetical protein